MAVSRTKAYKDTKKLEYKTSIREGTFIADYVKTKYSQIYEEAAALYNSINKLHPNKPNLRKSMQYRMWKNQMAQVNGQPLQPIPRQRDRYAKPTDYPDITAEVNNNMSETPTSLSPDQMNLLAGTKQFVLEIPLIHPHNTVITQASQDQQPETHVLEEGDQPETHVLEEGDQPETHVQEEGDQPETHVQEEGDQSETRVQGEEGGLLESLDPSLFDAVPSDVVDKIIADLQKDPDLKQIMDDLQNQHIHEQIMDLEIDFPDLEDPLQEEIDNLTW